MFGSEADGLSQELKDFATKNITIEMAPNVESLNLSVSACIIMYKIRN
jgi:tRNA G18 (ribose-2'-O)-methylase SpoU